MKTKLLFIFLLLICSTATRAQNPATGLQAAFEADSVKLEAGRTFHNSIVLLNRTTGDVIIDSVVAAREYPGLLFTPTFSGVISKNENQTLKVRMIAGSELLLSGINQIEYFIFYKKNNIARQTRISFQLVMESHGYIAISGAAGETFFNPSASENFVRLMVENPGYSPMNITLKYELMPGDIISIIERPTTVYLAPRQKQLITLRLKKHRSTVFYPDINLYITATESGKTEVLSTTTIPIQVITNNRQVGYAGIENLYKNFAELSFSRSGIANEYTQFKANMERKVGAGTTLGFNTTTDYFTRQNYLHMYDTRLELKSQKLNLAIGNIYGSDYDVNLSGRGIKAGYQQGNSEVEAIAMENNFLLFTNIDQIYPGNSFAVKYAHHFKNQQRGYINFIWNDNNAFTRSSALISNFKLPVYTDSVHALVIEGGVSEERSNDPLITQQAQKGAAAGIDYQYVKNRITFSSNNYFSTPFYAGIRRGSLALNEMLTYRLGATSIFARYLATVNKPRYFLPSDAHGIYHFNNDLYQTHQVESGINLKGNKIRIGFVPNYSYQRLRSFYRNLEYEAYRIRVELSGSFQKHFVSLSADGGLSKLNDHPERFYAARYWLSYRIGSFNADAMIDMNPVNLYDIGIYQQENYINYSTGIGYSLNTKNKKLTANINASYNRMNAYNNSHAFLNTNASYRIASNWYATGMASYAKYINTGQPYAGNSSISNYQLKIGLKRTFGTNMTAVGNKITLELFEDDNLNGIKDQNEKILSNVLVRLNNNIVAMTNARGIVKYSNLEDGSYAVSIYKNNLRLPVLQNDSIVVTHNKTFKIPVIKTNPVAGKLKEIKERYDAETADIMGITIYAQNTETKKLETAVTDAEGSFAFQLPQGQYRIYIENDRYEIVNNAQQITVQNGQVTQPVVFEFKKKDIIIKVKKF